LQTRAETEIEETAQAQIADKAYIKARQQTAYTCMVNLFLFRIDRIRNLQLTVSYPVARKI